MNDEQYLLANAYVDGEITDDDRVVAERDPAVMAEVAAIRAARAAIADVPPPAEEAKRTAIAGAMAEFDRAVLTPPRAHSPTISGRATRSMRWLQVAAAVTAIGLGGLVVSRGLGGGDDDDAGSIDRDLAESAAVEPAPENADEPADEAATAGEAEAGALVELAEGGYAAQLDPALPGRSSRTPIRTSDDLLEYTIAVSEAASAGRPEPDLPSIGDCDIDEPILADAFVDDGSGSKLALIGIDVRLLITRAYDPDTCEVLLEI